jgi:signal peptidase
VATSFVNPEAEMRTADTAVRILRLAGRTAGWALMAAAVAAAVGLAVLPRLGLYRSLTVLSASMVPTFRPGDMVVVRPEPIRRLRVGDVITYQVPVGARQVETHRVVEIVSGRGTDHPVIRTKGDANTGVDPWLAQLNGPTVWRLTAVVPKAGYAINALRSPAFHLFSVILVPAALALVLLAWVWGIRLPRRSRSGDAHA